MAFPLVIKFGRYFNGLSLAASLRVRRPLTSFPSSLETIDEIRVAPCRRRLPDTASADVPTSHDSVGMPLSRRFVDNL